MIESFMLGLKIGAVCIGICTAGGSGSSTVVCPPVRTWTPEFQERVAAELAAAPKKTALVRVVGDAITDRDMARACAAHGGSK